ncbi:MAG TPA: type II toxin-antitoxin system HicA family toxin [Candidatus Paceibacterota bacterium]
MRVLGGKDLLKIFSSFGFKEIDQRGSHLKMRRIVDGDKQTLTVPIHKEIDKGLLKQIFVQASQYISEEELKPFFYS